MIKLKNFQNNAINQLLNHAKKILTHSQNEKKIFFEAPTGAGKTIILSMFIQRFFQNFRSQQKFNFAFLWFSPGKGGLHRQSKKKIQEVLSTGSYQVMFLEEVLKAKELENNNVVIVVNWEKITKKNNRFRQDNEEFDLQDLKQKIDFIALIDEEHYNKSNKAKEAIALFKPKIIIRTSATLSKQAHQQIKVMEAEFVRVNRKDVIQSGLIKKNYLLNPALTEHFASEIDDVLGEDALLIEAGLTKQKKLREKFLAEGSDVNPLMIIQLADEKNKEIEWKNKQVKFFLQKKEINFTNDLLAINLDKEKINLENLKKNNNQVVCIITKQTITQGWDCPRAHILVKLRERSHKIFNIQTLGRISRMPEIGKIYQDDTLNSGYVYTFDKALLKIKDYSSDIDDDRLLSTSFFLSLKEKHQMALDLILKNQKNDSNFLEKINQRTFTNLFTFAQQFNEWWRKQYGIGKNTPASAQKIKTTLEEYSDFKPWFKITLEEGVIAGSDYEKDVLSKKINLSYKKEGLAALRNNFINYFCLPLTQKLRAHHYGDVEQILILLFTAPDQFNQINANKKKKEYLYDFQIYGPDSVNTQAKELYYCFFLNSREKWFQKFKEFYDYLNGKNIKKNFQNIQWEKLEDFSFSPQQEFLFKVENKKDYEEKRMPEPNKSLYQGFLSPDRYNFSQPEINFIKNVLEVNAFSEKIVWWYRNQENRNDAWKIIYLDNMGLSRHFYPDFILKIKNQIWIIEIKDGKVSDKNSKQKFQYLKTFCKTHGLKSGFILVEDEEIKINFKEWTNDYQDKEKWLRIKVFFDQII